MFKKDFLKRIILLAGALQNFCALKETHKKFHHLLKRIELAPAIISGRSDDVMSINNCHKVWNI